MKILHITEKSRFSGAEILIRDLAISHLDQADIAIASLNPTEDDFKETMKSLEQKGVHQFIPNHSLSRVHRLSFLVKVFQAFQPDIVVGHSAVVSAYMRIVGILFPKIKKVVVLHAAADYEDGGRLQKAEYLLQYMTDYVVGVSDWSANMYKNRFAHVPCKAIYNGVYFSNFSDVNLQFREDVRNNIFYSAPDSFVVIQVGRVSRVKNQLLTLQAISKLSKDVKQSIKIVFAGIIEEQDYYNEIQNFLKENNMIENVLFLGARSDIGKMLYASDLYVMPSERENFSIAILEALSTGIPIIYSNISQFEFLDKYDYKQTYKVDLDNIDNYKYIIEYIIQDKVSFVTRDLENFSFEKCSQQYLKLFKEITK